MTTEPNGPETGNNPGGGYDGEWRQYPDAPGHRGDAASIDAADMVAPHIGRLQAMALGAIRQAGEDGLTVFELAERLKLDRYTIQPRVTELKVKRLVIKSGRRRPSPSGATANVWVITEEAA